MYSVNEQYDIEVSRGDSAALRIDLSGRDLPEGTEAVFTVKRSISDDEPVLQKRIDASDEILTIALTPQETNLEPGVYYWDVRLRIPLETGGYEIYTPMEYAALVVLDVVGTSLDGAGDLTVNPDLPVIPQLISEMKTALLHLHPSGSLYLSLDDTDPAAFFGGVWERIEDTFLLAAGSAYAAGSTGGEARHKITEAELPFFSFKQISSINPTTGTVRSASSGTSVDVVSGIHVQMDDISFGSTIASNNMPPYLAVYVWKRTA